MGKNKLEINRFKALIFISAFFLMLISLSARAQTKGSGIEIYAGGEKYESLKAYKERMSTNMEEVEGREQGQLPNEEKILIEQDDNQRLRKMLLDLLDQLPSDPNQTSSEASISAVPDDVENEAKEETQDEVEDEVEYEEPESEEQIEYNREAIEELIRSLRTASDASLSDGNVNNTDGGIAPKSSDIHYPLNDADALSEDSAPSLE